LKTTKFHQSPYEQDIRKITINPNKVEKMLKESKEELKRYMEYESVRKSDLGISVEIFLNDHYYDDNYHKTYTAQQCVGFCLQNFVEK